MKVNRAVNIALHLYYFKQSGLNVSLKLTSSRATVALILFFILASYARDFFLVFEYFLSNSSIPYHRINIESKSYFLYIRDVAMVLWNFYWIYIVIGKDKSVIVLLMLSVFYLFFGIVINLELVNFFIFLSDVRVLLSLFSFLGVILIYKYSDERMIEKSLKSAFYLIITLAILNSIISIIQLYLVSFNFGFRLMGVFSNSQMNGYIMLVSSLLLVSTRKSDFINNNVYMVVIFFLLSLAVLCSGTRTAMFGQLILICSYFFHLFFSKKDIYMNIAIALIVVILSFFLFSIFIGLVNDLAGRGDVLNQDEGRIYILKGILASLSNEGFSTLFFGKGVGFGSSVATAYFSEVGVNNFYLIPDGTLQYFLIRQGLLGAFMLLIIICLYAKLCIKAGFYGVVTFLITLLVAISINILEIYLFMVILAVNIITLFCIRDNNKSFVTNDSTLSGALK